MAERARILIVEDERETAEMLTAYFESQGYDVMHAAWGQDALNMVAEKLPDLVLLDIRLPDMDGYDICRQLRLQRRTQNVPIIFLTERRDRIDKLQGLQLGAVDYITKPFDIQELKLRVRNTLRRSSQETTTDPVTGVPTGLLVQERVTEMLRSADWVLIAVRVGGLEAFSEAYGFVARDDTARALALILVNTTHEVAGDSSFVGQMSQCDFIVITDGGHARDLRDRLMARLKGSIDYFYPQKDERSTAPRPPLKVYMGIIGQQTGQFADPRDALGAVYSTLKPIN